jgi:hypothetical protein
MGEVLMQMTHVASRLRVTLALAASAGSCASDHSGDEDASSPAPSLPATSPRGVPEPDGQQDLPHSPDGPDVEDASVDDASLQDVTNGGSAPDVQSDAASPPPDLGGRDGGALTAADAATQDAANDADCEALKDAFWAAVEAAGACPEEADCTQEYELPTWCPQLANGSGDTAAVGAAYDAWTAENCSNLQGGGSCGDSLVPRCQDGQCRFGF